MNDKYVKSVINGKIRVLKKQMKTNPELKKECTFTIEVLESIKEILF
jgi:hypothetical protein